MNTVQKFRLLVLISGNGSNLQALIDTLDTQLCEIVAVVSNKADAYGLQRAQLAGIKTAIVDHRQFPDRESFDSELARVIDGYQPDLIIMAGFMRILTEAFINHFPGRMINIHPSLLPRHKGLNTHQRAIDAADSDHGVTVHYVTIDLDGGPLIAQGSVKIEPDDDAASLALKVQQQEHILLPKIVDAIARKQISLEQGQVYFQQQSLQRPLQLNHAGELIR